MCEAGLRKKSSSQMRKAANLEAKRPECEDAKKTSTTSQGKSMNAKNELP
jgi:hypothetical protein